MKFSEDRISHLAHLIVDGVWKDDLADYEDDGKVLQMTKRTLTEYFHLEDKVDDIVRKKIASYSRNIPEGSREWDVMYKKHFEEEMKKHF